MSTIPHAEATHKIYFTRDYTRFKAIKGNRLLNEKKIDRIIEDIQSGLDMLKYCPIIVDEHMNVIDGQHRLYVARKLKSNIWYVIADEKSLYDIAKINSNTERWKTADFINCYTMQGNKHYEVLAAFMERYKFPLSVSLDLLAEKKAKNAGADVKVRLLFEQGKFKTTEAGTDRAQKIAERVISFKHTTSRPFILAIIDLMDGGKCDFAIMLKKLNENPDELKQCGDKKTYLISLESIYNKGNHTRKPIY